MYMYSTYYVHVHMYPSTNLIKGHILEIFTAKTKHARPTMRTFLEQSKAVLAGDGVLLNLPLTVVGSSTEVASWSFRPQRRTDDDEVGNEVGKLQESDTMSGMCCDRHRTLDQL